MRLLLFAAQFFLIAPFAIANSEPERWSTEGDWEVFSGSEVSPGCFARQLFEDGTEVQIGTDPNKDGWYFAAYNPNWTHLSDETVNEVEFEFPEVIFRGNAEVRKQADVPGGYAFFNNPEFLDEFGNKMSVRISGPDGESIEIGLSGSKRAITAVENCQDAQPSSSDN